MTNTTSKNVTSTVPIKPYDKNVRYKMDCYIFAHSFSGDHIDTTNCYYLLSLCKT